jgi:hypothetical protein
MPGRRLTGWSGCEVGTGASFTPGDAQVGQTLRVVASYTDLQGTAETVTSDVTAAVINVNDAPMGAVLISGTPTEDGVLTVSNTITDADGMGAVSYAWQAFDGMVWVEVGTGASFTPGDAQVGQTLRVVASYTDLQGTAETVTSDVTAAVINVNDAPMGAVLISGTPTEDGVLTVSNTITDADGMGAVSYSWQAFDGMVWVEVGTGPASPPAMRRSARPCGSWPATPTFRARQKP